MGRIGAMGISTKSGSLTCHGTSTLSQHEIQIGVNTNKFAIPNEPLIIGDKEYTQQIEVQNTFTNRTALDPKRYTDIHQLTLAYPSAFTLKVTFFNRYSKHNTSTYASSSPQGIHPVHKEYTQIDNYELKVVSGFEFSYDQENNKSDFTGEAIIYPGFVPKIDDFFIMDLGDGHLGLCRISNVVRLSMRQAAYHKVDVYLFAYMNDQLWKDIQASVTNKVVFNKEAYFNDSISLLQHESYNYLNQAIELKQEIINYYFKTFYNRDLETLISDKNIYDPYLVEFIHHTIPLKESHKRPFQHINPLQDYERSLWSVLENKKYRSLKDCYPHYNIAIYDPSSFHVGMNALYQHPYIVLKQKGMNDYIFRSAFYTDTLSVVADYDLSHIFIQFLVNDQFNIKTIMHLVSNFTSMDHKLKFYHLPLYIYLLNEIISKLLKGIQP
jgi:hypothetical protein